MPDSTTPVTLIEKARALALKYWVHAAAFLLGLLFGWLVFGGSSGFANPNAIHRYVVGLDGTSLDDRINAAAALDSRSSLTGTRDVPVFFQDFNSELVKDSEGNLNRVVSEGLSGTKDAIDDLERKMMLG